MKTKKLWIWSVVFGLCATAVLLLSLGTLLKTEEPVKEETKEVIKTVAAAEKPPEGNQLLEYADGNRAMTIAIDDPKGVAGFIEAGDHVDIVAKMKAPDEAKENQHDAGSVLLQNVKVLAIGHAADGEEEMERYQMVTFEVSPEDGLILGFATNYELYLMLRNDGDETLLKDKLHVHEDVLHKGVFE